MRCAVLVLAAAAGLSGCGTFGAGDPLGLDGNGAGLKTLVPNKTFALAPSVQVPVEGLILGAAALWYVDPLSPNWSVREARVGVNLYRISLRRKPIVSGGDGEAYQLFQRHAEELAQKQGHARYTLENYSEGIESTLPFARRVASGVVLLR